MPKSVYIHIPYCKSKCHYCSFVSFTNLDTKKYLSALKQEIQYYYKDEFLNTLYFGGGTPSLLKIDEIKSILEIFNTNKTTEITMEINPDTVDEQYIKELKNLGINRLSIGCQTFDDNILKLINRRHNSGQVIDSVKYAQKAGFKNISLDFIYGLPSQTIQSFANDLKTATELGVQHISLYGLKIENNCYFYKHKPENLPDEDIQADMYLKAADILKGFEHYEISNFGIPSRHNLNYWNNQNYYGFGISAHGYTGNTRYSNAETPNQYFKSPVTHKQELTLTPQQILEEEIFLGFRKLKGINIKDINEKFNINFEKKYAKILDKYKEYFYQNNDFISLNLDGILISNYILAEFLE